MSVHDRYPDFMSDQRKFFDELVTEDWQTYFSADWDATRIYEINVILKKIQPRYVLDIGCGVGFHDFEIAKYDCVEHVDGIDYSAKSIERANTTYPHNKVSRFVADLATFEPERRYDLIASFQVFEHLDQPKTYFDCCARAIAPGGLLAIVTPNRSRLTNRLRARQGLPYELLDPQHFREYTIEEIHSVGREFGFEPDGGFGYLLWGWPPIMRLSHKTRLWMGGYVPSIAHGICAFLRAPR